MHTGARVCGPDKLKLLQQILDSILLKLQRHPSSRSVDECDGALFRFAGRWRDQTGDQFVGGITREDSMHIRLGISFGIAAMLMLTVPVQAEYLLNCRLMDQTNPDYKRYCAGELSNFDLVRQCSNQGICIVKAQNFKAAYAEHGASSQDARKSPGGSLIGASASTAGNLAGSLMG